MMRFKASAFLLALLLLIPTNVTSFTAFQKNLPAKYQEWLKMVQYIMLSQEREVFMQLTNNMDRDIFIETFWKQRDPTPGTPQNERKDEHMERWQYANSHLGRNTPREGWMTDQGRIYIILGPPLSIENFEAHAGIYPCQVWSYYGDRSKGLPTYFQLLFFQRNGFGEWKLYNSISDGPWVLLHESNRKELRPEEYTEIYMKIRELAPTLASPAFSIIPGEAQYSLRPSLRDNIILSDIIESPRKDVNPRYATHFLNYKGEVSTEYLTNYIESEANVAVIQDPLLNINFIHFSISPKSISIDYFEPNDQYFCNFQLNISLRKEEEIIFQYSKDFPFYFLPEDLEKIQRSGIALQDSFPIIEGEYQLNILVQNSVGKEFFIQEQLVKIPEDSASPSLLGPVVGYSLQDQASHLNVPYKAINQRLLVDPKNTVSRSENVALLYNISNVNRILWETGRVEIVFQGLGARNPTQKTYIMNLRDNPFYEILSLTFSISAMELPPDYYEIKLHLKGSDGATIDESSANLVISSQESIPHPTSLTKAFPLANNYMYYYSLAYQYNKMQKLDQAEAIYARAYSANPEYKSGLIEYANFLLRRNKFDQSLSLIDIIKDDEDAQFQYLLIKGKAFLGKANYAEAIDTLLQANVIYDSDTDLLGSLGYCYYQIGDNEKALDALKASLSLNPDQENVRKLISEIEKQQDF